MNKDAESAIQPVSAAPPRSWARVRRASLAVIVVLLAEYVTGMYVNLYVAIPRADHGKGPGTAIINGPATLSIHIVIGLLLGIGALSVLIQAIVARHLGAIVSSAAGLLVLASASAAGSSFTSEGRPFASMAMSLLAGVGLLCYGANLYLLRLPRHY